MMMMLWVQASSSTVLSIEGFGAKAGLTTKALENGRAMKKAMDATQPGDTVLVPYGKRYYMIPSATLTPAENVTLLLKGELTAFDDIERWPQQKNRYLSLLDFRNVRGLTLKGGGLIHGRGHWW